MNEITNAEILKAVIEGFAKADERLSSLERRMTSLENKVEVLQAQHKDTRSLIQNLPDEIEAIYGKMLNSHEDRIRILETS